MADDDVLLRLFVETRSEDAFEQLVTRHLGLVYGAALRLLAGDRHRAEDVTQVVFTKLAAQAHRLKSHPSLTSWLYVTTRNIAVKWIRSEQRRKIRDRAFEEMRASDPDPEGSIDWGRISPVLDQAICDLNPPEREALLLRFFQGYRFAAIAAIQRVTEDGARMRVNRALERLRQNLDIRGFVSTTSALSVALTDHSIWSAPEALRQTVITTVLAKGATSGSALVSFLMSTTKIKIAVGLVVAGLGLLLWEQHLLRPLYRNIAQLQGDTVALQRRLNAEIRKYGSAPIPEKLLPTNSLTKAAAADDSAPFGPPKFATAEASTGIGSDGEITWGGKKATIDHLIANLAQFHREHPETTAQVLVNAQGCAGYQLVFSLDEARKYGVNAWLDPNSKAPVQADSNGQ